MASQPDYLTLHRLCYDDLCEFFRSAGSLHPGFTHREYPVGDLDAYRPGSTAQEVAASSLLNCLFKKFEDTTAADAKERCLLAFLESNYDCSLWEPPPRPCSPRIVDRGYVRENPNYMGFLGSARRADYEAICECLLDTFSRPTPLSLLEIPGFDGSNPWSWENIFLLGNNGPGASINASGCSWFDKFYQSSLSYCNPLLLEVYQQCLGADSLRALAERQRDSEFGSTQVYGGTYGSVPKSFQTERSIETQPALEMWAQKGIAAIMEHFVRAKYGVDLSVQPEINRELARRGSLRDHNATVDLKEASNRIPLKFITDALAGSVLLDRILQSRVKHTRLPWGYIPLHMVGTMGNGFTFILETAIFLAVVEACHLSRDMVMRRQPHIDFTRPGRSVERWADSIETRDRRVYPIPALVVGLKQEVSIEDMTLPDWGVFGDDIIVPKVLTNDLLWFLEIIGACVNLHKTHFSGGFRESCGADWWYGVNVRPVYCHTLKRPEDKISLLNRLVSWSARWGIPLKRTCVALWSKVPEKFLVPLDESDDAGLKVPSSLAPQYPKTGAVKAQEFDLQRKITPYRKRKARPYVKHFENNQLVIYGPGLLLGMLKGEIVSSWQALANEPAGAKRPPYFLKLIKRELDQSERAECGYDTRWAISYGWDVVSSSSIPVSDLEWSLGVNLGLIPR